MEIFRADSKCFAGEQRLIVRPKLYWLRSLNTPLKPITILRFAIYRYMNSNESLLLWIIKIFF